MDEYDLESVLDDEEETFDEAEFDFAEDLDEPDDDGEDEVFETLEEDDDDEIEDELAEYRGRSRPRTRGRSYGRLPGKRFVNRARPKRSYTGGSRGRRTAIIRTPVGNARVRLPGGIPSMSQLKRTSAAIQKDIKKNSLGIKQLEKAQKALGSVAKGVDKSLNRKVFGLQLAVVALSVVTLPQARALISSFTSNP